MSGRKAYAACILGLAAMMATAAQRQPEQAPLRGDSVYQLPASFTGSSGQTLAWKDLRGKARVATMFYTSCRYVCPMVIDSLRAVDRGLSGSQRKRLGFVLISMDPERDTPRAFAKLMLERHLDPANWLLLSPRSQDVRSLAGILGIRYRALADGEFNHTTTLILLDAEGRVLARTDRIGGEGDPEFLAAVKAVSNGN